MNYMVPSVDTEARNFNAEHPFDVPPVRFGDTTSHLARNESSPLSYEASERLEAAERREKDTLDKLVNRGGQIATVASVELRLEAFSA